jgi:ring-1,2-phenylacetyl-CoA epoxidase subunit PaaD
MTNPCDEQHVWELLGNVADPEIPALSVVDLGIVRHIQWNDAKFIITVTPTYAGCPAMTMIESDIQKALESEDIPSTITRILAPAWTTAWLSDSARA